MESAREALAKKDYAAAEAQLRKAEEALAPFKDTHVTETQRWMADMGDLQREQQKPEVAEQYYRKALALTPSSGKDGPAVAQLLAKLAYLYVSESRFDLARDNFNRSSTVYQKNFKKEGDTDARQVYGAAIAHNAWELAKIAAQMNEPSAASKECRAVLEFQSFLSASEHEMIAVTCQQASPNLAR